MKFCGIPKSLISLTRHLCYKPRLILFTATGPFANIGEATDTRNIRCVTLRKGLLMGDPMTKLTLHLLNIICRESVNRFSPEG